MSGCTLTRLQRAALARILIVAVSAPLGAAKAAHPIAAHPAVASRLAILDAWIAETVERRDQPGLSVGIVYDQDLIWAKGYGLADVEAKRAATPATVYRIASITKLFTATALMQLRDQGKLRLRPPHRHPPAVVQDQRSGSRPIPPLTIWHLMTHLAGLPLRLGRSPGRRARICVARSDDCGAAPAGADVPDRNRIRGTRTSGGRSPGKSSPRYPASPTPAYIERHILEPLGMRSTFVTPQPTTPELARPVLAAPARQTASRAELLGLGGADAGREHGLDGRGPRQVRGVAVPRRAQSHRTSAVAYDAARDAAHSLVAARLEERTGLGFAIRRVDDQEQFGHGGVTAGFRTQIQMRADDKMAVIVLANADDGDPGHYVDQVFAVVGPAIHEVTHPKREMTADPAWQRYVGRYGREESDNESQVAVLDGELTLMTADAMVSADPWDARVRLAPVREHVFRMRGGLSSGELVVFQVDPQGRVIGMKVATSSQISTQANSALSGA